MKSVASLFLVLCIGLAACSTQPPAGYTVGADGTVTGPGMVVGPNGVAAPGVVVGPNGMVAAPGVVVGPNGMVAAPGVVMGPNGIAAPGITVGANGVITAPGMVVGPNGITMPGVTVGPGGITAPGITVGPGGITAPGVAIAIPGTMPVNTGAGVLPASFGVPECDAYAQRACNCSNAMVRPALCSSASTSFQGWSTAVQASPIARDAITQACGQAAAALAATCGG